MWVTLVRILSTSRQSNQPIWTHLSSSSQLTAKWLDMVGLGFKALLAREETDLQWQWWIWLEWQTWLQLKTQWLICGKPIRVTLCSTNSRCNNSQVSTEGKLSRGLRSLLPRNIAIWYKGEVRSLRKLTTLSRTLMWTSVAFSSNAAGMT